ncbi:ABC transporter permease [Streptosporangium sp. NPDC049644]|uniref:ABC transporter permease n=1 Tax=Streptosporangium sp. NPDC049644 TaxID=3155507 RepID=UPI00343CEE5C
MSGHGGTAGTLRRPAGLTARQLPSYSAVLGLLIVIVLFFSFSAPGFLSSGNINSLLGSAAIVAVLGLGMTPTIISGGIDLSVASSAVLCAVVCAEVASIAGTPAGALAALVCGCVVGAVNGVLISVFGMNAFVITLAGMQAFRGLARLLVGDQTMTLEDSDFSNFVNYQLGPLTLPIWLLLILTVLGVLLLRRTYFGRNVFAIGGNETAATLAGIPVWRTKLLVYVLSGLCAGIAAIFTVGLNADSASPSVLVGVELTAAAAVLLGGTSLTGGSGTLVGTVIAAIFFSALSQGLNLLGITATYWQLIITGLLLVAAVVIDRVRAKSEI